jgi:hypothetical protein
LVFFAVSPSNGRRRGTRVPAPPRQHQLPP